MAVNQPDCRGEDDSYSEWELLTWPTWKSIKPKARQVEDMHRWKLEDDDIRDQIGYLEGGCISMNNADETHLVTPQPCAEEVKKVKSMLREWKDEIKRSEDPAKEAEYLRAVVAALNTLRRGTYKGATEEEITNSTERGFIQVKLYNI